MDCIYMAPLSKALYNLCLSFTHSHTHSHTNGNWLPCKEPTSSSGALGVRCLAQGHFDTPRVGSNRQPSDCQTTALTSTRGGSARVCLFGVQRLVERTIRPSPSVCRRSSVCKRPPVPTPQETGRPTNSVVQSSGGGGIWGLLETLFCPLLAVWRFISSFIFGSPPPPGTSARAPPQGPGPASSSEPKR